MHSWLFFIKCAFSLPNWLFFTKCTIIFSICLGSGFVATFIRYAAIAADATPHIGAFEKYSLSGSNSVTPAKAVAAYPVIDDILSKLSLIL